MRRKEKAKKNGHGQCCQVPANDNGGHSKRESTYGGLRNCIKLNDTFDERVTVLE